MRSAVGAVSAARIADTVMFCMNVMPRSFFITVVYGT